MRAILIRNFDGRAKPALRIPFLWMFVLKQLPLSSHNYGKKRFLVNDPGFQAKNIHKK
jgi:hypothetical protein